LRIYIDIGHPAHVHYFKNFINTVKSNGHSVYITSRDRYPCFELLNNIGQDYYNRGTGKNSIFGKIYYTILADFKIIWMQIIKFHKTIKSKMFFTKFFFE